MAPAKKRPKRRKPRARNRVGASPASNAPEVMPGDLPGATTAEPTRRGPGRPPKAPEDRTQAWTGIKLFTADVEALAVISEAHGGAGNSECLRRAVHHYAQELREGAVTPDKSAKPLEKAMDAAGGTR